MYRNRTFVGLKNESGVSCHIASAIQLLLHAFKESELENLIHVSEYLVVEQNIKGCGNKALSDGNLKDENTKSINFIISFGRLAAALTRKSTDGSCDENESIAPSAFYEIISSKLNSLEAGDASSSLRVLILLLKQSIDNLYVEYTNNNEKEILLDSKVLLALESLRNSLYTLFWNGTMSHQLSGSKIIEKVDDSTGTKQRMKIIRCKPVKDRILPPMITIPMNSEGSPNNLTNSFNKIMNQSQPILGFDWETLQETEYEQNEVNLEPPVVSSTKVVNIDSLHLNDYQENLNTSKEQSINKSDSSLSSSSSSLTSSSSDSSSSSSSSSDSSRTTSSSSDESSSTINTLEKEKWITQKKVWLKNLPDILLFQLKRFEYKNRKTNVITKRIWIPPDIHFSQFYAHEKYTSCDEKNKDSYLLYNLSGAIVHTDQNDKNKSGQDDIGHYITYLRNKPNEWVKIDDEKVSAFFVSQERGKLVHNDAAQKTISLDQLLNMFGGSKSRKGSWCAFVLMYERSNE